MEGGRDERVAHPVRQRVRLRRVTVRVLPGQRLKAAAAVFKVLKKRRLLQELTAEAPLVSHHIMSAWVEADGVKYI